MRTSCSARPGASSAAARPGPASAGARPGPPGCAARPHPIHAAALLVLATSVSLFAPAASPAAPPGDGPVVLYSRGESQSARGAARGSGGTARASRRVTGGGTTAGSKAKAKTQAQPINPLAVKPPFGAPKPSGPAAGSKGKGDAEASAPLSPTAEVAKELGENGQVDPIMGLGLPNPACDRPNQIRDRRTRLACEMNGTPESIYPSTNYGFDTFIDTGVDAPTGNGLSVIVWLLNGIWLGVNFILRCVFELLGLAFGLNPFGEGTTMRRISGSIHRIYNGVTGPWLSTLVVMAGIWLAYKGLIKREVGASVAGTVGAIAMLIVGLWIVQQPGRTVGRVANMANNVSLGVISAPQSGSVSRPMGSFAEAMSRTWPRLIEVPFAGLNFSDVTWALGPPPKEAVEKANEKLCDDVGSEALFKASGGSDGDVDKACDGYIRKRYGKPRRVIDLYLRSSPNSPPREALWQYFDKDEADRYKAKVAAQGGDGVLTRLSMLALFLFGLIGAVLLLAWLALRLFTQAAVGFVLLLAAPFALFFPLLGDSGRRAFKTWGLTLLGAMLAKVIYAAFLSIVLLGIAILGRTGGAVGFLLAAAFSWAVFLKRLELVKWLSVGDGDSGRTISVPAQIAALAFARRIWKTAKGTAGGLASMPDRQAPRQLPQRPRHEPREPYLDPALRGMDVGTRGLAEIRNPDPPPPGRQPREASRASRAAQAAGSAGARSRAREDASPRAQEGARQGDSAARGSGQVQGPRSGEVPEGRSESIRPTGTRARRYMPADRERHPPQLEGDAVEGGGEGPPRSAGTPADRLPRPRLDRESDDPRRPPEPLAPERELSDRQEVRERVTRGGQGDSDLMHVAWVASDSVPARPHHVPEQGEDGERKSKRKRISKGGGPSPRSHPHPPQPPPRKRRLDPLPGPRIDRRNMSRGA